MFGVALLAAGALYVAYKFYGSGPVQEDATSLRARAVAAGDAMARAFEESHEAYDRRQGKLAKELSEEGKKYKTEMEELNARASEMIFAENNKDRKPGIVDLHGLYVREALAFTERAVSDARRRGDSEVHLIVGKGLHSQGGVAKIKPAIEALMQKYKLVAAMDTRNAGVLVVHLDGRTRANERTVRADEISRHVEKEDRQCIVM